MATASTLTADSGQPPRLYGDLAEWYPLLTPADDYAEEADFYFALFKTHCRRAPRTLLDLGSGGGYNAAHLKAWLSCTLVDLAPAMLAINQRLNPECEHIAGDMRTVRLHRAFDAVLVHDAVCYMTTRDDVAKVMTTAYAHTAPGGVALFQPDFTRETFVPGTESGGGDGTERSLRYLEWRWQINPDDEVYLTDMVFMLKTEPDHVDVVHDRHHMGLFPRRFWLEQLAKTGFTPLAVPFQPAVNAALAPEVFLGLRPP